MFIQCTKKHFSLQITQRQTCIVPWLSLIFFLTISALLLGLGAWQYTRYIEQKAVTALWHDNQHKPKMVIDRDDAVDAHNNHRTVQMHGFFVPQKNLFVDNALYHHQPGYQVITPFKMAQTDTWILINRGWIPYASESHRELIPDLPDMVGPQTVEGQLYCPQKRPFLLNNRTWGRAAKKGFPMLIQTLDLPRIQAVLNHDIHACYLRLASPEKATFMREWYTTPMSPYRHLCYAIQWSLFATIFWVIFYLKHRHQKKG